MGDTTMTEYTPTLDEVRECFLPYLVRLLPHPDQSLNISNAEYSRLSIEALDRFLATHDAEVAANAWDQGYACGFGYVESSTNPYRADPIEREATNHKPSNSEGADRADA